MKTMPDSEEDDVIDVPLCEFCDAPIPARRLKMKGAAKNFCRNACMTEWMDAEFSEDEPDDDLDGDLGDDEGPTLQEVMDNPAYTPGQKLAAAAAWGAKRVWEAFRKERGPQVDDLGAQAPMPAEGELQVLLMKLKLPMNATKEMISDRRRSLAKKYHPDVAGPKGAKAMAAVNVDVDRALQLCELLGRA